MGHIVHNVYSWFASVVPHSASSYQELLMIEPYGRVIQEAHVSLGGGSF